jgi:tetratricopeptide (TPR) repeat protein
MPRKIKVQRNDVKEPDEFISTTSRIMAYAKKRYRMLAPVAGAVILLVLIAVVWYYYQAGRERVARESFNQAVALYQAEGAPGAEKPSDQKYREALTQFTSLEENSRGTESGVKALFYLGEISYHLREYDRAIDYYNNFISRSRSGHYLRCFAYEGLGYCYEEKLEYAKAIDFYKQALSEPSPALPDLLCGAIARCYEALNDKANALAYYKKITADTSGSILLTIAGDRVKALAP